MANSQRKKNYVDGNTVRRIAPAAVPRRREVRKVSRTTQRNREREMKMSAGYVAFLIVAVCVTLAVCIGFVCLRSDVTSKLEKISILERQLQVLEADNDAAYSRAAIAMNLEEIKRIAMEEYGMVYAGSGQVILYEREETDYMRQYQEIPGR